MPPIPFKKKLRYLVPNEIESGLLGSDIYTVKVRGWSSTARESGIFFDLSRVEWVELGATVQILLLIEAALKEGIQVTVALPLPRPRQSEEMWMQANPSFARAVLNRIANRKAVLDFLTYLEFQKALKPKHLGAFLSNLHTLDDFDSSGAEGPDDDERAYMQEEEKQRGVEEIQDSERLYRVCFPFRWLSLRDKDQFDELAKFIAGITSKIDETHHGIEPIDANTIANVVLYELVDNVGRHAGKKTPYALVVARVRPSTKPPNSENHLTSMHPYMLWLTQKKTSIVEIVVGDSGDGIFKTLERSFNNAKPTEKSISEGAPNSTSGIMIWAFDRWSSSREDEASLRGTRGLYRVDRIVKKYQGIVTLRAENQMVGFDHGGPSYDERLFHSGMLSYIPGTILNLWLPPFRDPALPRKPVRTLSKEIDVIFFDLGVIGEDGISPETRRKLEKLLNNEVCVVADARGGIASLEVLERTLRQAVEMRHPGALVIFGLPGEWSLIEEAVARINEEHKEVRRDIESYGSEHFEIWDPVLIIGPQGDTLWVGATSASRRVLDSLVAEGGRLSQESVRNLLPDEKDRMPVLLRLRNDTSVLTIHDDQSLEMRFNFLSISKQIEKVLERHISKCGAGVRPDGVYRTPSLQLVRRWFDIREILRGTSIGSDMAILALAARVRENESWEKFGPGDFILSDSTSHAEHIKLFQKSLSIDTKHKEELPGEAGIPGLDGRHLIDEKFRVIVYFDLMISNEAAIRCLQQVLRDRATPVAVSCLLDGREDPTQDIEVWGVNVPVIALSRIDILTKDGQFNNLNNITDVNPITRKEEEKDKTRDDSDRYRIKRKPLLDMIERHNALHFSHIGRPIGRHFTFYLGSSSLIEEPKIYEAFDDEINAWEAERKLYQSSESPMRIEIWHPESEPQPFAPAKRFAETISRRRKDIAIIRTIRREAAYGRWSFPEGQGIALRSNNILIIDWGALTGDTVMQMIRLAAEAGADGILVCIFLSQLPLAEENFLNILNSLVVPSIPHRQIVSSGQLEFPLLQESSVPLESQSIVRPVMISVRFLGRFPIEAYPGGHECPVCQRLAGLAKEVYPTELLADFSKLANHERLRERKREDVLDRESEDFLPRTAAIKMALLREDLVSALTSTKKRQKVLERIDALETSMGGNSIDLSQEVLPLLTFLSIESQWLREPPLYLQRLRESIARISLAVALNKTLETNDRLNALIVLRTSSKSYFARHFGELFISALDIPALLVRLLYDAFTYIARPYHHTVKVFEPLLEGLSRIKMDYVGKGRIPPEIEETIDVLIARAKQECAKAGVRYNTPAQSWLRLRELFSLKHYDKHYDIPKAIMIRMRPGRYYGPKVIRAALEDTESGANAREGHEAVLSWIKKIKKHWNSCCEFLDNHVFPDLAHLKPILQLDQTARMMGGREEANQVIAWIENMVINRTPLAESKFSKFVNSISGTPHLILEKENWDIYIRNVEWFTDRIFRPVTKDHDPSNLIQLLMSAPIYIGREIKAVYDEFRSQLPGGHKIEGLEKLLSEDHLVFCTEQVLHDVLGELFENIRKRLEPEDAPVTIWIEAKRHAGKVILSIRNNYTRVKGTGTGLDRIEQWLQAFGGGLKRFAKPQDAESTYRIDVILEQGE